MRIYLIPLFCNLVICSSLNISLDFNTTHSRESKWTGLNVQAAKDRIDCPVSDPNFVAISDTCYFVEDTPMTYDDAQLNCQNKLGTSWILFEPRDFNTNKLVFAAAGNLVLNQAWWLGMNDRANEGQYVYASDKQDVVNGLWRPGEPNLHNERCVLGYYKLDESDISGEWLDYPCDRIVRSICQEQKTGGSVCFQKGLFVEGSIPMPMTFKECEDTCENTECCKFITWFDPSTVGKSNPNPDQNNKGSCGLRCFETTDSVNAPGLITSKKTSYGMQALSTENKVYVAKVYLTSSQTQCQDYCRSDPQCNTVTFFDSGSNSGKCVLNYGPTLDKLTKIPNSDTLDLGWTAPKNCP